MEQGNRPPQLTAASLKAHVITGPLLAAAVLFTARGTLAWWEGWAYSLLYAGWSLVNTAMLAVHARDLLARRLKADWPAQPFDRAVSALVPLAYAATLAWSARHPDFPGDPEWFYGRVVVYALLAWSYANVTLCLLTNSFALKGIAVAPGQTVCSTGPYSRLRHPIYASIALGCLCTPPALGSLSGLKFAAAAVALVIARAAYEDRFLLANLPGYRDYAARVKWRLLPFVW